MSHTHTTTTPTPATRHRTNRNERHWGRSHPGAQAHGSSPAASRYRPRRSPAPGPARMRHRRDRGSIQRAAGRRGAGPTSACRCRLCCHCVWRVGPSRSGCASPSARCPRADRTRGWPSRRPRGAVPPGGEHARSDSASRRHPDRRAAPHGESPAGSPPDSGPASGSRRAPRPREPHRLQYPKSTAPASGPARGRLAPRRAVQGSGGTSAPGRARRRAGSAWWPGTRPARRTVRFRSASVSPRRRG